AITEVRDHVIRVRGHDLIELARRHTPYEAVASLVLSGRPQPPAGWERDRAATARLQAIQAALPPDAPLLDRIRANVVAVSAADPLRRDVRRDAVLQAAAPLVAAMVDGLPGAATRGRLAARLWPALTATAATERWVGALNGALVLLVDHDLAASTFAARVAASTRADPYSVVLAALGAFAGARHGAASGAVHDLLHVAAAGQAGPVVASRLAGGDQLAGFGHPLYPDGDPRARVLLDLVRDAAGDDPRLAVCEEVLELVRRRTGVEPNVDFGLATLTFCAGMPRDAGEAVFATARAAGWLAHAIEEYDEEPLRFRPVTRYVGT
ncbi:MAG TPA: citrate/2-methylcitrate synthase, partial [Acidimicrobiales bacterium]